MADWFVRTHGVPGAPLCFDLGGPFTPVSIRDQMLRAQELTRRLLRARVLSPTRPLTVVGAGAAGATAALFARGAGVTVHVVEKARRPFGRQHRCASRWVDPTQYDWPMPHWSTAAFPWIGSSGSPVTQVPMSWRASWASHLHTRWTRALVGAKGVTRLHDRIVTGVTATGAGASRRVDVAIDSPRGGQPSVLIGQGAVIGATGMGTERCQLGAFTSWAFWDLDPMHWPHRGLPAGAPVDVLISGAGDGALQDYIRVATGAPSAAHVWNQLQHVAMPTTLVAELLAAEDHLKCAYACNDGDDDHVLLSEIHDRSAWVIDEWHRQQGAAIDTALGAIVDPAVQLTHVYACNHFTRVYSLNRFLVMLIHRYLRSRGRSHAISHHALRSVTGIAPHACANDPWQCHGQAHEVAIDRQPHCGGPRTQQPVAHTANVVILRHGIAAPPQVFGAAAHGPFRNALAHYPLR